MRDARESTAAGIDDYFDDDGRQKNGERPGVPRPEPQHELRPRQFGVLKADDGRDDGEGNEDARGHRGGDSHGEILTQPDAPQIIPFRRPSSGLTGLAGADWLRDWPRRRRAFPYRMPLLGDIS
jgi:hypothetical protein